MSSLEDGTGEPPAKKQRSGNADDKPSTLVEGQVSMTTDQTTVPMVTLITKQVPVCMSTDEVSLTLKTITVPMTISSTMATGITAESTSEQSQNYNSSNRVEQLQTTQGILQPQINSTITATKPIAVITSGNIRPSLNTQSGQSSQQKFPVQTVSSGIRYGSPQVIHAESGQTRPIQISSPITLGTKSWTTDGKLTLQISPSPSAVRGIQSKLQTAQTGITLATTGAPRYPSSQVVTLQNRISSPTSLLSKPTATTESKIQQQSILKTSQIDPSKTGEPVRITTPTQISFQMPANWNPSGTKSLLDNPGKLSLVSLSTSEAKSLLHDIKGSETATSQHSEPPKLSFPNIKSTIASTSTKTVVTGNKVLTNLGPGQVFTQTSTGLISVPRTTKSNSFVISNKQYTIMPSNSTQVVTQLVKTDTKVNKAKITMAEAQIMLPSGPRKISWPVHQAQTTITENKQILITSPTVKGTTLTSGKSIVTQKPFGTNVNTSSTTKVTTVLNLVPTAKVVETIKPPVSSWSQGNGVTSTKTTVLPAQKNWELVKQCKQLNKQDSTSDLSKDNGIGASESETKVKTEPTHAINEDCKDKAAIDSVSDVNKAVADKFKQNESKGKNNASVSIARKDSSKTVTKIKIEAGEVTNIETTVKEDTDDDKIDQAEANVEMMEVDEIKTENDMGKDRGDKESGEKDDFNAVDAMTWEDGVGELPGSDLKFRMNDLGVLEVITDDLECTETLNTSNESEASEANNNSEVKNIKTEPDQDMEVKEENSEEVSNKDEISQCENCGEYGFTTDFYKGGRFCSQTCIGAFDSKRMRGVKKHGTMSKVVLGLKKGRKKLLLTDGFHRDKDIKSDPSLVNTAGKKSKAFVWTRYLEQEAAVEAPARLFKNPFPSVKNNFRVGMKLEGTDPMHQSLFCALSVPEVCGYRIRLHFDGYSECFDFWTDIDCPYIYPIGFCEKNGKILQPPKGFTVDEFSWSSYLKITKGTPAPKSLFSNQPVQSVTPNLFRVGSKLEAVDKKNSSLICVASVADTLGDKVLIHFDSWDDNYDYWCDMTSPFIHPTGYCDETNLVLSPPIDWKDPSGYTWEKYLSKTKCQAVPARAFKPVAPVAFEAGMKVEVVDRRNPLLVRVATIMEVENYMVRIHFDGWSDVYDYWLDDDSPDLHPPGWCAKTGHPLVPPISPSDLVVGTGPGVCPTPGCKGIGHIKGAKYSGHHSTFGCPYSELNMNKESVLGDRLGVSSLKPDEPAMAFKLDDLTTPEPKKCPTEGCDGSGHVTGKCLTHYKASGCPILHAMQNGGDVPKKFGRGRRPKSYYLSLAEKKTVKEREQERHEKEESLRQGIHNSVFSSSMISTPKTEVPLCWDQHSKLLPGVTNIRGNDVNKWTIEQVAAFVNTLPGCEEQAKLFKEEQIDGEAFLLLTQADIVKIMNIRLGPALKIFNSIIMFKNSVEV